jgi:uncharacterized MAPEG superfamily protein
VPIATIELKLLVWCVFLTLAQMAVATTGAILEFGLPAMAGNREDVPRHASGWAGRASRAHHNMLENLVLFAVLVVAASIMARLNAMTALGAQLFFWGRVAYAPIYIVGVPYLRTAAFAVSIVGLVLIFSQLL